MPDAEVTDESRLLQNSKSIDRHWFSYVFYDTNGKGSEKERESKNDIRGK